MIPKKGQIWKENDNRFLRYVEIVKVTQNHVYVKTISLAYRDGSKGPEGRTTVNHIKRFNGESSGYSFYCDSIGDF